jgi:hypothetical protein
MKKGLRKREKNMKKRKKRKGEVERLQKTPTGKKLKVKVRWKQNCMLRERNIIFIITFFPDSHIFCSFYLHFSSHFSSIPFLSHFPTFYRPLLNIFPYKD